MSTCIAYYSKTKNTEIASEYLAEKLSCGLIELKDDTRYKGATGFLKGGFNASRKASAKLDKSIYEEISEYDTIVLATPVWAGKTTPAINAVLENIDFTGKKIYAVTYQADPNLSGIDTRREFYKDAIARKGGEFIELYAFAGSSPGKTHKDESSLKSDMDKVAASLSS